MHKIRYLLFFAVIKKPSEFRTTWNSHKCERIKNLDEAKPSNGQFRVNDNATFA